MPRRLRTHTWPRQRAHTPHAHGAPWRGGSRTLRRVASLTRGGACARGRSRTTRPAASSAPRSRSSPASPWSATSPTGGRGRIRVACRTGRRVLLGTPRHSRRADPGRTRSAALPHRPDGIRPSRTVSCGLSPHSPYTSGPLAPSGSPRLAARLRVTRRHPRGRVARRARAPARRLGSTGRSRCPRGLRVLRRPA